MCVCWSHCNNWIVLYGMENVKYRSTITCKSELTFHDIDIILVLRQMLYSYTLIFPCVMTASFIFSHSLFVNSFLSLLVPVSYSVTFELLLPKHLKYLPLPIFFLIPLIVHSSANNHAVPSLSFLVQRDRVHDISFSNYNSCLHRALLNNFRYSLHPSLLFLIIRAFFSNLLTYLLHGAESCLRS